MTILVFPELSLARQSRPLSVIGRAMTIWDYVIEEGRIARGFTERTSPPPIHSAPEKRRVNERGAFDHFEIRPKSKRYCQCLCRSLAKYILRCLLPTILPSSAQDPDPNKARRCEPNGSIRESSSMSGNVKSEMRTAASISITRTKSSC